MKNIIVLAGPKGSGKSTVADWLVKERNYKSLSLADKLKDLAKRFFPRLLTMEDLYGPSSARERRFSPADKRLGAVELQAAITWLRLDPDGREALNDLFGDKDPDRQAAHDLTRAFDPYEASFTSPRTVLQRLGTEWGRKVWNDVWLDVVRRTVSTDLASCYVIPDCRFPNEAQYLRERLGADVYWVEAGARIEGRPEDKHASEPRREDLIGYCTDEIKNDASVDALFAALSARFVP
jgi:hypothetical protein